jgi:hypothetical protein
MILLAGLIGIAAALVPLSQIGFRDGLQRLLRNFDIAREQYGVTSPNGKKCTTLPPLSIKS